MPTYETLVSHTYDSDEPRDAAAQFFVNLNMTPSWFIQVRDTETGEMWDVDAQTGDIEELGSGWVDWPDEPGFYWFYGYTNLAWAQRHTDEMPQLLASRARGIRGGKILVDYGAEFIWQGQKYGKFLRIAEPPLPKLDDIREDTDAN